MLRILLCLFILPLMAQNVLVTGGAGFIGSHVCKQLHDQGYTPITYDNLECGLEGFVKWGPFVKGDLLDKKTLIETLKEYQPVAVMHLAAAISVRESTDNPSKHYWNNVVGTLVLLDAMKEVGCNKLIFSSSCAVYGTPKKLPVVESTPYAPQSPYGRTKQMIEDIVKDYDDAYNIKTVTLRYFNVNGCDQDSGLYEQRPDQFHLVPLAFKAALGGDKLKIFGADFPTADGTAIRDYIHVQDIASAHIKALTYLATNQSSNDFNLGTGHGFSVREVLKTIETITSKTVSADIVPRRPGEPTKIIADISKAKKLLDWEPKHSSLENILGSYYYALQQNLLENKP